MPELRRDHIASRWVIIATERGDRPHGFGEAKPEKQGGYCPFCEGNEDRTPPEIIAVRKAGTEPNTPGWKVRVVPNKYPALQIEGDLDKRPHGLYDMMNGIGAHEVIIESPEHHSSLTQLSSEHVGHVLKACRDRLIDLKLDPRFAYGLIFKNVGQAAGATLEHSHSQIIVTPIVPSLVEREIEGARRFFDYRGRCIFCDMLAQELAEGSRIVIEDENFVSFTPFASRFPFETWLVPRTHHSHFETTRGADIEELADVLRRTLTKLENALENAPYNYVIHTAPFNRPEMEIYHWHIEIIPRLTKMAGFEWGSGFYINSVPPETAAEFLRQSADEPMS